ncbi:GAF domain-containing protein [Natronorubrum sp. JWXQ-INN-674]|uniref:GAF domain-containing protein n=1 Tax=Natronorubrum halalkaliphilum TaxID=2691917 RepID=A0A6B0VT29_9EURY|nr:bacterio-opsin activator domain-containing protein [Natronorubrum halalkaliphilum]MXV63942.1 GAF domain-containing protein [Natronorubrum halalkaliphilum]
MNERLERAPIGVLEVDRDGTVTAINDAGSELLDVDPEAAAARTINDVFPRSVEDTVPNAIGETIADEQSVEEYYPELDRWLEVSLVPTDESVTLFLRDRTAGRRTERTNDRLRDDLDRIVVLNGLISEILNELIDASTREEIAETICERLGESDIYEFAWFGERELGDDRIAVRAAAGTTGRTLERVTEHLDGPTTVPEERAVETGTPEVIESVGEDPSVPESVRRAAFADGLQSLLAIPLTYGTNVYGAVGVYASDRDAFSERERASFATVGEMAGFAVNATRHRNILLSDTVVELTFEITDAETPLVAVAAEFDVTLSLDGLVPQRDGRPLCYLSVDDEPHRVANALTVEDAVERVRVVADYGDEGSVELTLGEGTPLGRLSTRGATVRSAKYEAGSGRIVIELPPEEDVRRIADAVTRTFDAAVIAKQQRERSTTTAREFRDELRDRLTDHQANALRTAFFADYFESPRESSAEDVADALGITGPTLLYHLRAGQRKLLASFFDPESDKTGVELEESEEVREGN